MTVSQVAKRTGAASQTIIHHEKIGRSIRFTVMFEIVEALGHKLKFRFSKSKDQML